LLTSVWGLGHASVGDLTFESAAYVARYVMKKVNGSLKASAAAGAYGAKKSAQVSQQNAREQRAWQTQMSNTAHYEVIDYDTGEVVDLKPEYTTMSRRPGIAGDWFDKYKDAVYPSDTKRTINLLHNITSDISGRFKCQIANRGMTKTPHGGQQFRSK
jgi:hypothetical protein